MARSEEHETSAPVLTPMLMVNSEQYGAQELHRQQEELRKKGIKLDRAEPGGKFLDSPHATTYHDAWGNPVGGKVTAASASPQAAQAVDAATSESELDALEAKIAARRETLAAEKEAREEQQKAQAKADQAAEREREKAHAQQEKDAAASAKKSGARR